MLRKLVFFAFLAVAAACMAGKRVVAAPQFAVSTNPNFVVEGVELGDTATLLHCALNLIGGSTPVTRQSMIPGKDYTSLLTPIGEPSYVTEYHLKHHRYED